MSSVLSRVVFGFFTVVAFFIVFVKAGSTGHSGGQQTAEIIQAVGNGGASLATGLYGNR